MAQEWQTVPKEPTVEMLDKAVNGFAEEWKPMRIKQAYELYKKMLSVAPQPPQETIQRKKDL